MKVAMLLPRFPVISETFILNQIIGLINKGYDVDILTFNNGDLSKVHSIIEEYRLMDKVQYIGGNIPHNKVKRVLKIITILLQRIATLNVKDIIESVNFLKYGKSVLSLRCLYALTNTSEKKSYDIIHCQYGTHGIEAVILKRLGLLEGKIVTSFRGFDITRELKSNKKGYKQLFKAGDAFLPVCNYFGDILKEIGCPSNKIHVLYSGIDIKNFKPVKERKADNYFHILTTARLEEKKGLRYAIKAVSDVIRQGKNIKYTIIGNGSLKKELTTLIKTLNAQSSIKLIGSRNHDEIKKYLASSDLFLAPSVTAKNGNQEGIPNSIKEAMLMKVPVVSTYHSGIPELIEDKVSGFLVPERDSKAIYMKILFLYKNSNQYRITDNARKIIINHFSTDKLNDTLEKIYIELLKKDSKSTLLQ